MDQPDPYGVVFDVGDCMRYAINCQRKSPKFHNIGVVDLINVIREHGFVNYDGGVAGASDCICTIPKQNQKLHITYSGESECNIVEPIIRPLFDVFISRRYKK